MFITITTEACVYYLSDSLNGFSSIYIFQYLIPQALATIIVFGVVPSIAEVIGLSRTSFIKKYDEEEKEEK